MGIAITPDASRSSPLSRLRAKSGPKRHALCVVPDAGSDGVQERSWLTPDWIRSQLLRQVLVIGMPLAALVAVNEASRLTDSAKSRLGRVLASEEAVSRAGDESTNWAVAGEIQLRGITEPTLAYEPAPAAAVFQATDPTRSD